MLLRYKLENGRKIMIDPIVEMYMDGHLVLIFNYHIFSDQRDKNPFETEPDFLGILTFEKPGQQFSYTAAEGTQQPLSKDEVNEIMANVSHHRDNPEYWDLTQV